MCIKLVSNNSTFLVVFEYNEFIRRPLEEENEQLDEREFAIDDIPFLRNELAAVTGPGTY